MALIAMALLFPFGVRKSFYRLRRFCAVACVAMVLVVAAPVQALVPDDSFVDEQWYLEQMDVFDAWDVTTGDASVVVAVLDTGVDIDHPDLEANIWENTKEVAGDGIDNDGNGFVDDVYGYDFVEDDGEPLPDLSVTLDVDAVSHGTIIAGIIGAEGNNGEGIAGINWEVEIMSVRILDEMGVGDASLARKGVEYAVENGADVINLSFTGFDVDPPLRAAIKAAYEAGVVVVAAMGNSANGIDSDEKAIFPVCYGERAEEDWILGVAATNDADERSSFSNYGSACTDIAAPGEDIASTVYQEDGDEDFSAYYLSGWNGTSMAAPMVAGAAALLLSEYPLLTPDDVKLILRLSVDPVESDGLATGKVGAGRLNIGSAMSLATSFTEASTSSLIKLTCDEEVDVNDPCKAVYYYADDGKRHAFPNEQVFFTWFEGFDSVIEVSREFMSSLTLGANVTYHPGTVMVKFVTVPTVYAVEAQGVLRPIASEEVAASLYGEDWNTQIHDIADVFFTNYSIGEPIESSDQFATTFATASSASLDDQF